MSVHGPPGKDVSEKLAFSFDTAAFGEGWDGKRTDVKLAQARADEQMSLAPSMPGRARGHEASE